MRSSSRDETFTIAVVMLMTVPTTLFIAWKPLMTAPNRKHHADGDVGADDQQHRVAGRDRLVNWKKVEVQRRHRDEIGEGAERGKHPEAGAEDLVERSPSSRYSATN
jgi:hypothetical protein